MSAFIIGGILILLVSIVFAVFRLPMCEVILASFLILTIVTDRFSHSYTY